MLIGRTTKDPLETGRFTVDFTEWLDPSEMITSISGAVAVALQASGWPGPWPVGSPIPAVPTLPDDPTPLTVTTTAIITPAGVYVQVFYTGGTDGNGYSISFLAVGSSGRTKEVRVDVSVRSGSVRALP